MKELSKFTRRTYFNKTTIQNLGLDENNIPVRFPKFTITDEGEMLILEVAEHEYEGLPIMHTRLPNMKVAEALVKLEYANMLIKDKQNINRVITLSEDTGNSLGKLFTAPSIVKLFINDAGQPLVLKVAGCQHDGIVNNDFSIDLETANSYLDLNFSYDMEGHYNFFKVDNHIIIYNAVSSFDFDISDVEK